MSIITRYLLRNHVGPFLFGSLTVVFLFLFQFILKYIDALVGKGLSEWIIIQLILYNTAWMLVLAVPMGVLFATLMAFGNMSQALEITVIKSSGGSLFRMMVPLLIAGTVLSFALFWFNDEIMPEANHQAKILLEDVKRTKPTFAIEPGQFTTGLEGYTILARAVDTTTGYLYGVTIYDNSNRVRQNTASADTGRIEFNANYTKLLLTLFNGEIHQRVVADVNNYRRIDFAQYKVSIPAAGFNFEKSSSDQVSRGDRELHIRDMEARQNSCRTNIEAASARMNNLLQKNIDYATFNAQSTDPDARRMQPAGIGQSREQALRQFEQKMTALRTQIANDASFTAEQQRTIGQYEVEIQKKYSIPFACLVFVLVGCPLGVATRRGNFGISAGLTLGFYIFYWACWIGGEKLADRGLLSPFLSMWGANFIVGAVGILLMIKINSESWKLPGWIYVRRLFSFVWRAIASLFRRKKQANAETA